jgi:hypothetical protein
VKPLPFVDFCERVLRVELTLGQRVLARVAFDGVEPAQLEGAERAKAAELLGPVEVVPPPARLVLAIVKGARIGGSYVFGGLHSLWRALTADLSTLAPGELAVALIVAPDLRLARQVLRYSLGAAESVPSDSSRAAQATRSRCSDPTARAWPLSASRRLEAARLSVVARSSRQSSAKPPSSATSPRP